MTKMSDAQGTTISSGTPPWALGEGLRLLLSRINVGLLVIVALPWMLLFTGTNWVFDYVGGKGFLDPWFYSGFFVDLEDHLRRFQGTYYGSRLSWILPGYLAYKLFTPRIAPYVLHFGVYYAAVFSLYFTLKLTASRRAALLATILMGGYGFFIWAVGWDYVDGAGIAYLLLTTMALILAAKQECSRRWLFVAGILYGAMIYSQLFLVVFTPPMLFYYFAANREWRRSSLRTSALFFTFGFVIISIFFGIVSNAFGGDFLFYTPSVRMLFALAGKTNPWKQPLQVWWKQATWLVIPAVSCFSSMGFFWKFRIGHANQLLGALHTYFLSCALILLLLETRGDPVLQYLYYASFLIPVMFLALGAHLAGLLDGLSSRTFALVVSVAVGIAILAYRVSPISRMTIWLNSHALFMVSVILLGGMAVCLVRGVTATALSLVLVFLALGLVNIANGYFRSTNNQDFSQRTFPAIMETAQAIQSTVDPNAKLLFWYRASAPMGDFYRSVASMYLWGYSLVNESFPSLDRSASSLQTPRRKEQLVLLSEDQDALRQADSALAQVGLEVQLVATRRIQRGRIPWTMFLVNLRSFPAIENLSLASSGWPESIELRLKNHEQQTLSLASPNVQQLFRSDSAGVSEWEVNRYGSSGGLSIKQDCFAPGDSCGLYASGDKRDHLASPFVALGSAKPVSIFFSIWVKRIGGHTPEVYVQRDGYETIATSRKLADRNDGWVLYGDRFDTKDTKQVRLVVQESPGSSCLLDKGLVLEVPFGAPNPASAVRQRRTTEAP